MDWLICMLHVVTIASGLSLQVMNMNISWLRQARQKMEATTGVINCLDGPKLIKYELMISIFAYLQSDTDLTIQNASLMH